MTSSPSRSTPATSPKAIEWCWIKDDQLAYIPARVLQRTNENRVLVETYEDRTQLDVPEDAIGPSIPWIDSLELLVDDLVQMDEVNEASILHSLRCRFFQDKIYTNVGDILVSINPFKWLPVYTNEVMKQYSNLDIRSEQPPHVFGIASNTYKAICDSTVR